MRLRESIKIEQCGQFTFDCNKLGGLSSGLILNQYIHILYQELCIPQKLEGKTCGFVRFFSGQKVYPVKIPSMQFVSCCMLCMLKLHSVTVAMCDTASLSKVGMLAASSGVSVAMSTDGVDG